MGLLNFPQSCSIAETAILRKANEQAFRWALPVDVNRVQFSLTIKNLSDDRDANFKFQESSGSPADDNIAKIGIPQTGGTVAEDAAWSENAVKHVETFGTFNATFTDIADTTLTIKPHATAVLYFTTYADYVQLVTLTANHARIHITGASTAPVTNYSKDLDRGTDQR